MASRKKNIRFKNMKSLELVKEVINEATVGLKNKNRTISDSSIAPILAGALTYSSGVTTFVALCRLVWSGVGFAVGAPTSLLISGMLSPVVAPVAALAGVSTVIIAKKQAQKLVAEKERLYAEAVAKQNAIIRNLKEEINALKERADYLEGLNITLTTIINDLEYDLGIA